MAALLARERTGRGQHIDISLMECMASLHQFTVNRYVYSGTIQKRAGNQYGISYPLTIYPCKDGYVNISVSTDDQAENMFIMMGMDHMLEDERFQTRAQRSVHARALDERVVPWFLRKTGKEIIESCQEWRVPASYVNNVEDLLRDPQFKARDFWVHLEHPEAGRLPYASAPFKMSETPARPERAPLLGEHNREIYCGRLGMSREALVRLRANDVI
jgi:CoA:oxalate CoA-transferase